MDLFERKGIRPMLIGVQQDAFDNEDYIFELKLDGIRCIAYLDEKGTDLRNKRDMRLLDKVPELAQIHRMVKAPCILDGELAVVRKGRTDFYEIQKRMLLQNPAKLKLASLRNPACFVAFDILYLEKKELNLLPLMERKEYLQSIFKNENEFFAISRYVEGKGKALFALTGQKKLEGVVAKRKDSRYFFGKRTKDWIKIKNMVEEDLLICGYIQKNGRVSLVLGKCGEKTISYVGQVTLGVSGTIVEQLSKDVCPYPPFETDLNFYGDVVWVQPDRVCTVEYMAGEDGAHRQMVFRGLREGWMA